MAETPFDTVINLFLRKIEKDRDFFTYYNVSEEEAYELAVLQATGYLREAINRLTDRCSPDVDFYDYSEGDNPHFNFKLTGREQGLLADLMREIYFERDLSMLKAFKIAMTPTDLNQFSPANERSTFMSMLETIKHENEVRISHYISEDRLTGKPKKINYGSFGVG